jgi:hypothetical protein
MIVHYQYARRAGCSRCARERTLSCVDCYAISLYAGIRPVDVVLWGNLRLDRCLTRPEEVSPPATAATMHSGLLTSAAESGASIWKLSEVSRHKSHNTLRGYVRRVDLFKEHVGAAFL